MSRVRSVAEVACAMACVLACVLPCVLALTGASGCASKNMAGGGGSGGTGGGPDMAMCTATMCGAECVDLTRDAHNCGGCGHDCAGAMCSDSVCAPVTIIAGGAGTPYAVGGPLFNDGTYIYFGSSQSTCNVGPGTCDVLRRCKTTETGMVATLVAALGPGANQPFAVGGGNAYWFYYPNGLVRCDLAAGCGNMPPTVWATNSTMQFAVVADGTNVYWPDYATNSVLACAKSGCAMPTTLGTTPANTTLGTPLLSDGTRLYYTNGTTIFAAPVDGSAAAATFAKNLNGVSVFAGDATTLYWVAGSEIQSCPKSGCTTPATLSAVSLPPGILAIDGTSLFWAQRTKPAQLGRCTLPACSDTLILVKSGTPILGMTVDATNVYFGDGSLKRVPR